MLRGPSLGAEHRLTPQDRQDFLAFFDQPSVQHRYVPAPTLYSDHVRVILLARYGGVWLDSDAFLVRDLTPLLRTGPFVGSVDRYLWTTNSAFGGMATILTPQTLSSLLGLQAGRQPPR